ncbi:hypothetical protein ALQ90_200147 [Pseudomonas savastanoi pv. savastanoi]|nr:hypothetical protein ALQ90_200147 [Pseudomonas savastanoi pv. savastanoi]
MRSGLQSKWPRPAIIAFFDRDWGCTPESPKIPSENIMRVVPGCFCYPIRFFVHIWPLNQAVFGLAVSLPENNCLASIRTSTGFPPMTEISGIPAYNPRMRILHRGSLFTAAMTMLPLDGFLERSTTTRLS